MRYLIKFSYNGSKFYGFQRLNDKKTVQNELEKAISIINKKDTTLKGAGRTDKGVHAINQGAHFDLDFDIEVNRLKKALNNILNPYININEVFKVNEDFHARFSCIKKTYVYKIWIGKYSTFLYDYYLIYNRNIDINKLKEVAKVFKGKHNFKNFVSGERDNYDMNILDISIKKTNEEIDIIFTGKSFYRYMVRNLVGAFLDYNEDKCDIIDIKKMLDGDICKSLSTAPAQGLYLEEVCYEKK